jgi:hypothetical protein
MQTKAMWLGLLAMPHGPFGGSNNVSKRVASRHLDERQEGHPVLAQSVESTAFEIRP